MYVHCVSRVGTHVICQGECHRLDCVPTLGHPVPCTRRRSAPPPSLWKTMEDATSKPPHTASQGRSLPLAGLSVSVR